MFRLVEFFEGDSGRLSMTRLLCFLALFPSSYVVVNNPSENMLGFYLGAYVLGFIGGKSADVLQRNKQKPE